MKSTILALLFALAVVVAGCKKDDDTTPDNGGNNNADTEKPVITLTSPEDGASYDHGDTIWIKGNVMDNVDLHEISIVINKASGEEVLNRTPHVHAESEYTINEWYVSPEVDQDLELIIKVSDHSDNVAEEHRHFHAM